MTKEVCYKALNQLQAYASKNGGKFEQEHEILSKLIKQHFDNPPLKFEELEVGMWVWYKPLKQWKKIYRMNPDRVCFQWIEFDDGYVVDFEENMFYRKQVEE